VILAAWCHRIGINAGTPVTWAAFAERLRVGIAGLLAWIDELHDDIVAQPKLQMRRYPSF
jgi:hypothetical protein